MNKRQFLLMLLFFALLNLGALKLKEHYHHHLLDRDAAIDITFKNEIEANKAEVALLGNSFLREGVDTDTLQTILGRPVEKIALSGSSSAVWYLILKNNIINADPAPQFAIIFFVDNFLTKPDYFIESYYSDVDRFGGVEEPLLDDLSYWDSVGFLDKTATEYSAFYRFRYQLQQNYYNFAFSFLPGILGYSAQEADFAGDMAFNSSTRDPEILTPIEQANWQAPVNAFYDEVGHSFLPEMLRIAAGKNVQLIFVRMKRLRDVQPDSQPPGMPEYMKDLEYYLSQNGSVLLDFTDKKQLTLGYFGEGDHLNEDGRILFTRLLARELLRLLN
jgi:hypothetical protein